MQKSVQIFIVFYLRKLIFNDGMYSVLLAGPSVLPVIPFEIRIKVVSVLPAGLWMLLAHVYYYLQRYNDELSEILDYEDENAENKETE